MKPFKRVLFILDPLEKLDPETDTSLALLSNLAARGYETWSVDIPGISIDSKGVIVAGRVVSPARHGQFTLLKKTESIRLNEFGLVLVRKEPPFDEGYLAMTYMLEMGTDKTFLSNDPRAIRNNNEKMSIFHFSHWIPKTLATTSPALILSFQKKLGKPLVIKPLDEKGGHGIFKLPVNSPAARARLARASKQGRKPLQAQEFLSGKSLAGEKRILILNGQFLGAYEKIAQKNEFRANLGLGGMIRKTSLTEREKALTSEIGRYSKSQGLHLVGLDVLQEKLIEINVTCPSGLLDLKLLEPQLEPVKAWADYLERAAQKKWKR